MPADNILTDQLNLVQREDVKGLFRLFSRRMSVSDGFCLVIFRKEEYRGSILADDVVTEGDLKRRSERLGVRDGDTILRINLGPRPLSLNEKLGTLDGYTRTYTLDLEISVNDPRSFAQRYLQWSDPAKLARIAIEGYLQRYAVRKRHDELRDDMLRDQAEQALRDSSNRSFGLQVVAARKLTLFMDPTRSRELEIQQQGILREKEIREESRIKQIETKEETNIRKAGVLRDAKVKRLETKFVHEYTSLTTDFERAEDEKAKRYNAHMEEYLLEEKARQSRITRIEEQREKDHQLLLEGQQHDFLRLESGRDRDATREQEMKDEEHAAEKENFKGEHRKHARIYEIEEQAHILELDTTKSAYIRRQKLLNTVGDSSIEALSDLVSQQLEDRQSLSQLLSEHPELRDVFQTSGSAGQKNAPHGPLRIEEVADSVPLSAPPRENSNQPSIPRADTGPLPAEQMPVNPRSTQETGTLPGILHEQNDTINLTDLGMTLIQTQLSAMQHSIASTHTPTAFIISALIEHGPAYNAQLATGDIVIEINGEEPRNIQSISLIMKSYTPRSSVSLCILRSDELKNIEVLPQEN